MAVPAPASWLTRKVDLQRRMAVSPVLMVSSKGAALSSESIELDVPTNQGKGILGCAPVRNRFGSLSAFLVCDPKLPGQLVRLLYEDGLLRRDHLLDMGKNLELGEERWVASFPRCTLRRDSAGRFAGGY